MGEQGQGTVHNGKAGRADRRASRCVANVHVLGRSPRGRMQVQGLPSCRVDWCVGWIALKTALWILKPSPASVDCGLFLGCEGWGDAPRAAGKACGNGRVGRAVFLCAASRLHSSSFGARGH
jgi:hypothetical protein